MAGLAVLLALPDRWHSRQLAMPLKFRSCDCRLFSTPAWQRAQSACSRCGAWTKVERTSRVAPLEPSRGTPTGPGGTSSRRRAAPRDVSRLRCRCSDVRLPGAGGSADSASRSCTDARTLSDTPLLAARSEARGGAHPRLAADLVAHPWQLHPPLVAHAGEQLGRRGARRDGEHPAAQVLGPGLEVRVGGLDGVERREQLPAALWSYAAGAPRPPRRACR